MAPAERSFDPEFYAQFAGTAFARLSRVSQALSAVGAPGAAPRELELAIQEARHVMHNVTGEARLLELPDYAALVRRTSSPLGRIGTPTPTLTATRLATLAG